MVKMTQSMEQWLWKYHRDLFTPLLFGHLELFTEELAREYRDWCLTDEGRQYLKGGKFYDPENLGNKASEEARK